MVSSEADPNAIPVPTPTGTIPLVLLPSAPDVAPYGGDGEKKPKPPKDPVSKDPQRAALQEKLQPRLLALYDCTQANNCKDGGQSTVKIVIIGKIDADALRALGFQGEIKDKQASGTLDTARLADLVRLDWVRFVALGQ